MDPPRCPSPPQEPQNRRNWPQKFPERGRTQLRNRRFAALRELIREGDYFSEERMRLRAPALFHHYIGRFRDPKNPQNPPKNPQIHPKNPQIHPKNPENHLKNPQNGPKIPQNGPRTSPALRELLLTALEEAEAEDEEDEEDEDEDEEDEDEDEEQLPDEAEQELLRLEFTSRMHQRFLEGLDGDFDYSQVDENPEVVALDLLSQDLEDRYFDEEEPGPAPPLL
ncbi:coiled-coil domain-containing protein 97 [Camarhynchus parvulus]|uniref:coiled-coil domain-containing protein 97 n=1 Tax=Geospiza parvula TaxID=87175 RepID=UPI001238327D|nr:coiled-coil domain-containing protein 97 [Camarhynchus parvulus]